ncbi:hypothetical protein L3V59_41705 [Burkholderia aenigmatica]|nr:hypothetical protein [Burkholderia aenigmatica]UKD17157.1 hypothetical protein L3V59_41705 [Burkholderia aenigmatica]
MVLDASTLKNDTLPEKRYTLIVALLNRIRVRARDNLADMFVRYMSAIHKHASDEWEVIQRKQRDQVEDLVVLLNGVADILAEEFTNAPPACYRHTPASRCRSLRPAVP